MAKTVKVGDKYYNEGVEVPAPKAKVTTSKPKAKKKMVKEKDPIAAAMEEAKARQKKFGSWGK